MNYNFQIILIILLIVSSSFDSFTQNKWILKKNSDGISVYTSVVEGSDYKAFRSKCKINSVSIEEIRAIILNHEKYDLLYPDTRMSRLIKKYDDGHFIIYIQTDAPWPADDRDGVYEIKTSFNPNEEKLVVNIRCIPGYTPVQKGIVRMTKGSGFWEVQKAKDDFYEIIYQYHGEAGGNIPAWIANTSIVSIPFKTLTNLKKILSEDSNKNGKLD